MQPVALTLVTHIAAPIERVFSFLIDPSHFPLWLPACKAAESDGPLRKGAKLKVKFGERETEFEVVDFKAPSTFGWIERAGRIGTKIFFRLDPNGSETAVTIRDVRAPRNLLGWVKAKFFQKRTAAGLKGLLENLKTALAG
jgi:uncharacterized protein YndB with AHSA1/START domain